VNSLGDVYKEIKQGPKKVKDFDEPDTEVYPNPAMRLHSEEAVKKDYKKYQTYERKLKKFNRKFKSYLRDRVTRANEILQNDFGQNFEIQLDYESAKAGITADKLNWQDPKVILKIPRYEGRRNVVKRAHSFLNEAKWTSIGLSIRFAILEDWTNRPNTAELKLLTIDDMLLSLDMSNRDVVLNLLLNRYSADYQILMMTHDRYFFELAKGKINASGSSGNWVKLEMYLDEERNKKYPLLLRSKTNLEKAKSFFKQKEFAASANHMRKATECFVYEFVPKNKQYDRSFNSLNLSQLINKSRALARTRGWSRTIISDLDQMRANIFNPGSHHDVYTPVFQSELKKAIETLEQVSTLSGIKL
jgi:wobble nucleotide-excising tRNase